MYAWRQDKIDVIVEKLAAKVQEVKQALSENKDVIFATSNRNFQSVRSKIIRALNDGAFAVLNSKKTDNNANKEIMKGLHI